VIAVICGVVAGLALLLAARWVIVCVLDALLAPDWSREDFELREYTEWKREQEGRSGDAAEQL